MTCAGLNLKAHCLCLKLQANWLAFTLNKTFHAQGEAVITVLTLSRLTVHMCTTDTVSI